MRHYFGYEEAINLLDEGKKVSRLDWTQGAYLTKRNNLYVFVRDNFLKVYDVLQEDEKADDWFIYGEENK